MKKKYLLAFFAVTIFLFSCQKKEILFQPGDEGSFVYQTGNNFGNRPLEVFYHIPDSNIKKMSVLFVMHGAGRNGKDQMMWTKDAADAHGLLLLVPNFPRDVYPSLEYQEGGIMDEYNNYNVPEKMTYKLIDEVFEYVFEHSDLKIKRYNIIGHSAGGQFVHRLIQFSESQFIAKAVAANAGLYTFPDETIEFPYGIAGYSSDSKAHRKRYYSRNLTILLGTADTIRDGSFRMTPEADLQGSTRLERGQTFFNINREIAEKEGVPFKWKIEFVDGVGHNSKIMSSEAVKFICNH